MIVTNSKIVLIIILNNSCLIDIDIFFLVIYTFIKCFIFIIIIWEHDVYSWVDERSACLGL